MEAESALELCTHLLTVYLVLREIVRVKHTCNQVARFIGGIGLDLFLQVVQRSNPWLGQTRFYFKQGVFRARRLTLIIAGTIGYKIRLATNINIFDWNE